MKIVGASPWSRGAIRRLMLDNPEILAELESRIPDGSRVVLTMGRSPGQIGAVLLRDTEVARTGPSHSTVNAAVSAVLWEAGERKAKADRVERLVAFSQTLAEGSSRG